MDRTPLPVIFRYHLVEKLMRLLKAGESAAVIGVASVGKSNLVRCLQQPDIQEIHLGREKAEFLFVLVDSNDLAVLSEWNFLELLLYRLTAQCQRASLSPQIGVRLDELHQKLLARPDDVTQAQRCVEQALYNLCQLNSLRVVLLLDEFEAVYQQLSQRFWANLRSLRDKNKYSLSYLLFLRRDLEEVRPTTPELEAFAELFQTNGLGLKPYDLAETALMLERLSVRQQIEWPASETLRVFELSGGHGGLIRVIFGKILLALKTEHESDSPALLEVDPRIFTRLVTDVEVQEECEKIWSSLSDSERTLLKKWVETGNYEAAGSGALTQLSYKGLLVQADSPEQFHLFSSLLADFVRQQISPRSAVQPHFYFEADQQHCWIEGQEIALPGLPAQLLDFLYRHRGKSCRRIELLKHLYPGEDHQQLGKIPDFRLDAVVKSLREKIEPDPQKPRYIITVRGVGFRLDIDE